MRDRLNLPDLTVEQILDWADAHQATNGDWPNRESGEIAGTNENWSPINQCLDKGLRGLPGGSTLTKLLAEHRGVRNIRALSPLTVEQILDWADAHQAATGNWPKQRTGHVTGTDETWSGIDCALCAGGRGLPGGSSLAKLLAEHRGVRNIRALSPLTVEQILDWADKHKATNGDWPNKASGQVTGTDETWLGINHTLRRGGRDLPSGSSLAMLLAERRGVRNIQDLPPLTIEQILAWADAHKGASGDWPRKQSGQVPSTDETWLRIDAALRGGGRGLPGGTSLATLLAQHRGVRNQMDLRR